ncbi:MAG: SpoIIIAH-like family protein [Lachnospiraceae bacterium]|nr:SpoIIIAH-like family protein [Lachnospiraceae bacterium]
MKNLIKKNQLMITALALMLAIAGYLQFAGNAVDDQQSYASNFDSLDSDAQVVMEDYLEEDMEFVLDETYDANETTEVADADLVTVDPNLAQVLPEEGEVPGDAVFTSTGNIAVLSEAKLLKEQVRSKNKETLMEIINSTTIADDKKQEALDTMVEMTEIAEKEMEAEILLEAKGFSDVVVSIGDNEVDIVVAAVSLSDAERAQIEDIVKRKTDIGAENIIISTAN